MNKKVIAAGLGLAVALGAGVATAAPELTHVNGLLVLPNTKIVNKPEMASAAGRGSANLRTFAGADAEGLAAQPTRAEVKALAAQSDAMRRSERAKSAFAPALVRSLDGKIEGIRIADLDDDGDLMPYSVVRREADGSLRHMCVQGHVHAEKFIANKAKGARNDR